MKKVIILLLLSFISYVYTAQVWVNSGTGLRDVSYQWKLEGMRYGCYFMGACAIGGLGTDAEMLMARSWAVNNNLIRGSDTYCNINWQPLAQKIASHFGTTYHSNFKLVKGCGHYWVVNGSGKEVFNAAGLGHSGC